MSNFTEHSFTPCLDNLQGLFRIYPDFSDVFLSLLFMFLNCSEDELPILQKLFFKYFFYLTKTHPRMEVTHHV